MPRATNLSRDVEEEVDKAVEVVEAMDAAVAALEADLVVTSEAVVTVKVVAVAAAVVPLSLRHRSSQSLRGTASRTFWQRKHSLRYKKKQANETN